MNLPRTDVTTYWPARLFACILGGLLLLASGCVYRPTIQQGNLLKVTDVDQVTVGMTRSQVRYLLGTPMISDPFSPDRWDYVYSLRVGHSRHVDRAHFVVLFQDDKVVKVERLVVPTQATKPVNEPASPPSEADREPPAPPSVATPQPDTPHPVDKSH